MNIKWAAVAAGLMLCAPASAATLVQNGSFEAGEPQLNSSGWEVFAELPGWKTISGAGIEIQTNKTLPQVDAQDGKRYVELDSHNNSAMQQILKLDAGHYLLSFWYAPRMGNPETDGIEYSIAGVIGTVTSALNPINGWSLITAGFSTLGGDVALTFSAVGNNESLGGLMDNVSVTPSAVPVPAAGLLLVGALGALGALRRRKA